VKTLKKKHAVTVDVLIIDVLITAECALVFYVYNFCT